MPATIASVCCTQGWIYIKGHDIASTIYTKCYAQLKEQQRQLNVFRAEPKSKALQADWSIDLRGLDSITKELSTRAKDSLSTISTISIKFSRRTPLEIRIRAFKADEQEEWYRFLLACGLGRLPEDTSNLLPGQVRQLEDIITELETLDRVPQKPTLTIAEDPIYVPMRSPPIESNKVWPAVQPPLKSPMHAEASTIAQVKDWKPAPRRRISESNDRSNNLMFQPQSLRPVPERRASHDHMEPTFQSPKGASWFISRPLGRQDAQEVLELNKEYGNMLVRRRTNGMSDIWTHAVSIKSPDRGKQLNWSPGNILSTEEFLHFKVRMELLPEGERFIINLSNNQKHPELKSWGSVIAYFESASLGKYIALKKIKKMPERQYVDFIATRPAGNR
ncbi:uncharacterized protein LOC100178250 [Ciona intestinalis]